MKYDVKMSCGHIQTMELFGPTKNRENKIRYYEESGTCTECFKKQKEAEAAAEAFTLNIRPLSKIDKKSGNPLFILWFSGNTKPHKDDIKSIGYYFSSINLPADLLGIKEHVYWNKETESVFLEEEIDQAKGIGVEEIVQSNDQASILNLCAAKNKQSAFIMRKEKISEIPKPKFPELLVGKRWNEKIYGNQTYSVYLDGKKVNITKENMTEIQKYLDEKEEYKKKIAEIKKEHPIDTFFDFEM